jgi:hypothetical protein
MCLVAVFALSALVASSASAAPEYKTCVKAPKVGKETPSGEFSDKACSTPLKGGGYKLGSYSEGKKFATKGKGSNPVNRQIVPGLGAVADVECKSEKSAGTITGPSTSTSNVEYKTCEDSEGKKCNTEGDGKGVIKTHELTTQLIDQTGATEGVGIVISPKVGEILATYECEGGLKVTAIGSVIGEVEGGATKAAVKELKLKFAHGTGAYQQFGYIGADEAENGSKFEEWFGSGGKAGTPPTHDIESHVEGNTNKALPEEFTLPATQEGTTAIKGEAYKIVG